MGFVYGGPAVDSEEIYWALQYGGVALPSGVALGLFYPGFDDLAQAGKDVVMDFAGGCASAIVG